MMFVAYMKKWFNRQKTSIEETTNIGYHGAIKGEMTDYFQARKDITVQTIKPKHIQDFYQYLLDKGLSGNKVKHYHANLRKSLQYDMKTDIIPTNPAD